MKSMDRNRDNSSTTRSFFSSSIAGFVLFAALFSGCISPEMRTDFKNNFTKIVTLQDAAKAREPIDGYPASEISFKLEKETDVMVINVTADYVADITGVKRTKKVFFIVEKAVDMSQFKNPKMKNFYAELGKNFDSDWARERELKLISNKTQPFRVLDGKSLYRIRFTTFSSEEVTFSIKASADCGVTFIENQKQ